MTTQVDQRSERNGRPRVYDLLIHGGEVIDPLNGISGRYDIGIVGDRIESMAIDLPTSGARDVIDATGCIVVPGLIDLHTHVFPGATFWGVDPTTVAWRTGVTTFVDAGSAGAFSAEAFRQLSVEPASSRVYAFLNISSIGLIAETGESSRDELCNVKLAAATIEAYPDIFVGVKCRLDRRAVGEMGLLPLHRAIEVAEGAGLPVMAHIGTGPPSIDDVLALLRPGDLLTHCATGQDMAVVDEEFKVRTSALSARDRGVLFDVGHGSGAFSFRVAEAMLAVDFVPDVISSDLHQRSIFGPAFDLPTCLSKFMALGVTLQDVIAAATLAPARVIRRSDLGGIGTGRIADIAVFAVETGDFVFVDTEFDERAANQLLINRATVIAGRNLPPVPPALPARWVTTTGKQDLLISEQRTGAAMRRPWVSRLGEVGDYVSYRSVPR